MKAIKSALLALAIAQLVDGAPSHQGDDRKRPHRLDGTTEQRALADEDLIDDALRSLPPKVNVAREYQPYRFEMHQEAMCDEELLDNTVRDLTANLEVSSANLEVSSDRRSSRRRSHSKKGAEKQQQQQQQHQEAMADEKLVDDIIATHTDGDFFIFSF